MIETRYEHNILEGQVPTIAGTTMKVVELVVAKEAYGWSAEELHLQFPQLSLGQIYSALAYYADHRGDFDHDIARRLQHVQQIQHATPAVPLRERLRSQGLIS